MIEHLMIQNSNRQEGGIAMLYDLTEGEKELIHRIEKQAHDTQLKYRGCSQTTLLALQENLGLGDLWTFKAATGFTGGVAGKGVGPCGALLGGMMAIGIEFGRGSLEEAGAPREGGQGRPSNLSRTSELCRELWAKFTGEYGGRWSCFDIQEHVYGRRYEHTAPEMQPLKATGEFYDILSKHACKLTATGARLAAEIILTERKRNAELGRHHF
jgi:C_GCAxxG_C_C family probable redox protein